MGLSWQRGGCHDNARFNCYKFLIGGVDVSLTGPDKMSEGD